MKFDSAGEWKDYCLNTHNSYLKNVHFRKWIRKKGIHIFNLGSRPQSDINHISSGVREAIRIGQLKFRVHLDSSFKKIRPDVAVESSEILKMAIRKRKEGKKENAYILVFDRPIKSEGALISDGEALTYVSEGIVMFAFDKHKKYSPSFLRRRAKHEALHMLGLNIHHEDTKVSGYWQDDPCVMEYNAPVIGICGKCSDAIKSFWKGIKNATGKS